MIDLATRSALAERMDDPDLPVQVFSAVLGDLATVNTITRARPPTLAFVDRVLARLPRDAPVTILDVGFGDGDMLRALARRLARTPPDMPIEYRTGDAFAIDPATRIDLIVSSLVTHHMADDDIVAFLRWMEARAALGWFINDLHRNALAYHGFRLLSAAARWHPIVRADGALSVARSFVRADWESLLDRAGIDRAEVALRWHLPFRWCLGRMRP